MARAGHIQAAGGTVRLFRRKCVRRTFRLCLPVIVAVLFALGGPYPTAGAHPMAPSLLEIVESTPGHATVVWKMPVTRVPGSRTRPVLPPQCSSTSDPETKIDGTALVQTFEIRCEAPLTGSVIEVDAIASSKANVILRVALADGRVSNTVLTADQPTFVVPERERPGDVVRSYLPLGVEHILTGFDHLLFVLGLMLLVTNRRQLLLTVTAFTAGHSVTLSLATLGYVNLPSGPIEALIALSILVVAAELTRGPDAPLTMIERRPWSIAFLFGLLHGFGFAGALSEIGLPANEIPLTLLSFNLGIEVGQLVFIAAVLGVYAAVRYLPVVRLPHGRTMAAYFIGSLAALWFIERAAAGF